VIDIGHPRQELAGTAARCEDAGMSSIEITVIDREGVKSPGVEWRDEESLMECLVRNSYPILATCGGNASCSTCHCYLDEDSFETAGEIDEDEEDVLDSLTDDEREPTSRLTCQIAWEMDLEGAEVTIGPF
jgi:2Fe-2S ferredoxin